jgi:hypothetical protein
VEQKPQPPLPLPPPPVPPPPDAKPTPNSQPHPTTNPAPDSRELNNTLEKLRALQRQEHPPQAHANPRQGGAPHGGGSPQGDENSKLSVADARQIGAEVQRCWTIDSGAKGVMEFQVLLTVTVDAAGVAREAQVAPSDAGRLSDPVFRAFAERARRAVLDPTCANLPLPPRMQGQVQTITFRFHPGA